MMSARPRVQLCNSYFWRTASGHPYQRPGSALLRQPPHPPGRRLGHPGGRTGPVATARPFGSASTPLGGAPGLSATKKVAGGFSAESIWLTPMISPGIAAKAVRLTEIQMIARTVKSVVFIARQAHIPMPLCLGLNKRKRCRSSSRKTARFGLLARASVSNPSCITMSRARALKKLSCDSRCCASPTFTPVWRITSIIRNKSSNT
jgi:hypothetical protein